MADNRKIADALLFVVSGLSWIAAAISFAKGNTGPASTEATIGIVFMLLGVARKRRSRES